MKLIIKNNDLIISRLHSEWILRCKQLETYYDYLVEQNTKFYKLKILVFSLNF